MPCQSTASAGRHALKPCRGKPTLTVNARSSLRVVQSSLRTGGDSLRSVAVCSARHSQPRAPSLLHGRFTRCTTFTPASIPADVASLRYIATASPSIIPTRSPSAHLALFPAATVGARHGPTGISGRWVGILSGRVGALPAVDSRDCSYIDCCSLSTT